MKRILLCVLVISFGAPVQASWRDEVGLRGYVRETPIVWTPPAFLAPDAGYRFDNILNGRANLRWSRGGALGAGLELKCRALSGESPRLMAAQTDYSSWGVTYFDWTRAFVERDRVVVMGTVDRAWLDWTAGAVEITAGRQRVAWGTGLVWNPIDLFNPFSPLDFDDEERPGTDAGRVQCFLGPNAHVEIAVAPQRQADAATAAALVKFNRGGYDWIVMGGRKGSRSVLGAAWAGSVLGGGFRGELRYDVPRAGTPREEPYATAAVDADYTFRSTLYLHAALLYNERGATGPAGGARLIESLREGALSPSRLDLFGEIARDVTPLVRFDFSGILNPSDRSWYLGPSLTWSATANLDLAATGLIFGGAPGTEYGDVGDIFMLRAKYSY
jgi:hypothetical protein